MNELMKEIKVHIPTFNYFFSKFDGESDISKNTNNSFKGFKYSKYNLNETIYSHRLNDNNNKNNKLGKIYSHSQEKDINKNYYYNLMINDDFNKEKNTKNNK